MKINDILNLDRLSSVDVEEIFKLKNYGRSVFSIHNNLGVDWNLLKKNVPGLKGYKTSNSNNIFFIVELNSKKFILVNYDRMAQYYSAYCNDSTTYEIFMKLLLAHSDLSYCHFLVKEDENIPLPDEDDYYNDWDD